MFFDCKCGGSRTMIKEDENGVMHFQCDQCNEVRTQRKKGSGNKTRQLSVEIRIDAEVFAWLQSLAVPLEDNANKVLRRVAGLDKPETEDEVIKNESKGPGGAANEKS